jgi:hypothetical protein
MRRHAKLGDTVCKNHILLPKFTNNFQNPTVKISV